jgi:hypothetical protein
MRRIGVLAALVILLASSAPAPAGADDVGIVAQVLPGSRTITTATLTPIGSVLRTASATGTLAVTVTEAAVNGIDPWSVSVRLCGPNAGMNASDCAAEPDRMVLATNTATKLTGSNLSISGRSVTPAGGGGTSTATAGSQDLSAARTIFGNTGQDPLLLYTGTYASESTVTLTPPAGTGPGSYTGYLVVTLVS